MLSVRRLGVNGTSLAYAEAGEGRPLVCVHGNFASKRWFTPQLLAPPSGWRVLAPDLPNFADSDALPARISINAYAQVLKGFVEGLGLDAPVLLGHSLGGAVAQAYAAGQPQSLSGLLLLGAAPPGGLVTFKETYRYLEKFKTNRALLAQSLGATMPTRKPSYFEALVDDAWRMNRTAFTGNAKALEAFDVTEALAKVTCPVLVVRGGRDYLISEAMAQRTAAAFSGARLEHWPEVGHSPQLEAPGRFNTLLIAFLKSLER